MTDRTAKIAVIGAGSVGATIAYAAMIRGIARQIVLYDLNRAKVTAEVLDLNHGLQFVPMAKIEGSDDIAICADADVVVITAGAKQKPGQTRMDLAGANAGICKTLLPQLLKVAPNAVYLLVTNPVDVITYIAQRISGLPPQRVFGSGTVLDSSRFRFLIAERLKVAVQSVHAYIAGEHGDSEVPLWSTASVANVPLHQWAVQGHGKLSVRDRTEIFENVKNAAYQIIAGKGATNYAVGLATGKILEAILHDEGRVLPVSSLLKDWRPLGRPDAEAIDDVCLSVPCVVNRRGVDATLAVPLNDAELAGLRASAERIREAAKSLGY
ncbi:L-lactate dehydrogenase [Humisphaera borealis]|uniref:L-lactate dehydrogenase n=1 Tax=Humisphaera borealis TaxID=2807512 RepID=A0A7M2WQX7_9BACT|nr:L-lactate dehydrogenase [Humisphaera borealis]QOV87876.1 L-lactate dehydrogenase [Humisphaera borealis]